MAWLRPRVYKVQEHKTHWVSYHVYYDYIPLAVPFGLSQPLYPKVELSSRVGHNKEEYDPEYPSYQSTIIQPQSQGHNDLALLLAAVLDVTQMNMKKTETPQTLTQKP
jgi:hypothetical protein